MKNIIQIGTFDVENYGDLLFPIIFENEINKRIKINQIFLFSPKGGQMPFYNKKVYPISELENVIKENKIDAIVIGGGDLIRHDKDVADDYGKNYINSLKIWEYPILIGKKYDIPVLFNAPGVPFPFEEENYEILRKIFNSVDYLNFRDNTSFDIIKKIGDFDCTIVPDSINLIPQSYSKDELENNFKKLLDKKIIPNLDNYIVVQHKMTNYNNEQYISKMKKLVDYITKKENKKIILVPIGYVHNDIKFLEKLYEEENKNIYLIKDKLSPFDMLTVFANSSGFIGTSLHGLLTSNAYGVPILAINTDNLVKVTGFMELIGKSNLNLTNIDNLTDFYEERFLTQEKTDNSKLIKDLNFHYDNLVKLIEKKPKKLDSIELDLLNENLMLIEKIKDINIKFQNDLESEKIKFSNIINSKTWKLVTIIRKVTSPLRFIKNIFNKKKNKQKDLYIITDKTKKIDKFDKKIAVQAHVYYTDLLDEIYNNIKYIPYRYDLLISTNTKEKYEEIMNYFKEKNTNFDNLYVEVYENRGRDILPFLEQVKNKDYDYICHIHTKKSKHSRFGDDWRNYLYYNLFGSTNNIKSIFYLFEKKNYGIIYPKIYGAVKDWMLIGGNEKNFNKLCKKLGMNTDFKNIFPSGSMFWIKADLIKKLSSVVDINDFEEEDGQLDGTMAHAIERIFVKLSENMGYKYLQISNETRSIDNE